MESADIIVINGLWLEEFLEWYLMTLAQSWVSIVGSSEWVRTLEFGWAHEEYDEHEETEEHDTDDDHDWEHDSHEDHDDHDEHETDKEHKHSHDWDDPHIWLDPNNAIIQTQNIAAALIEADPSQSEYYISQAQAYTQTLEQLDTTIQELVDNASPRPFILFHDAYQYFLEAYDLDDQQVGIVQQSHASTPSQKELSELIQTIESNNVRTIYVEPQFNPSVVLRLEQETWVTKREIDPIGTISSDNNGKDWYTSMLLKLAESFTN